MRLKGRCEMVIVSSLDWFCGYVWTGLTRKKWRDILLFSSVQPFVLRM